MIRDLFINSTILISFTFLWGQASRSSKVLKLTPFQSKLALGAACGILGSILIFFSILTVPKVYFDLRTIAVMIAVAYGGLISAAVSGLIIISARMIFWGISTASLAAASNLVIIIILCCLINRLKLSNLVKWIYMLFASIIVVTVTVFLLVSQTLDFFSSLKVVFEFFVAMLVAGMITHYAIEYVIKSNVLFEQFKEQSTKDFLTGLNNIRQFDAAMNEFSKRVLSNNEKLSILVIDIDHFKHVNDTYGHAAGDAVLKQLGTVLTSSCRCFDIVSRNGGEEFSVLLPDCPNGQAFEVAERIRKAVSQYSFVLPDNSMLSITVSIGVATYPDTVESLKELQQRADDALYTAKRTGRNKVCSLEKCVVN